MRGVRDREKQREREKNEKRDHSDKVEKCSDSI